MDSSTKVDSFDIDKVQKQIEGCITMCGGSSIEERFAGLLLLSKIPHAQDILVGSTKKPLVNELLVALNKNSFFPRLLILPNRSYFLFFEINHFIRCLIYILFV